MSIFQWVFFVTKKVTNLMATKNAKKTLKLTKNIVYIASSNTHSLATGLWSELSFVFNCADLKTPSSP